jgi:arsenate reductase (glutaredoxin)
MHKTSSEYKEISIFYNPECSKAKKAVIYAKSVSREVFTLEYAKWRTTPTKWREILGKLGVRPKDLMDKSKDYYQQNIRGREFEDEDWLNVLINNPEIIRSPIAVRGNKVMILDNPTDIYKF